MEVLEIDGKRYVKAAKAAQASGYTTDYVGQLCRRGKVSAHLVGRSWYVDADELRTHKVDTKRNSRVKAREQVRKELATKKPTEEFDTKKRSDSHVRERHISYESDETGLIPEVRKLTVESEESEELKKQKKRVVAKKRKEETKGPNYEVENKGEGIVLKGKLEIVDATDEFMLDPDAIRLKPRIQKGIPEDMRPKAKNEPVIEPKKKEKKEVSVSIPVKANEENASLEVDKKSSFERMLIEEEGTREAKNTVSSPREKLSFAEKLAANDSENNEITIQNLDVPDLATKNNTVGPREYETDDQSQESEASRIPVVSMGLTIGIAVAVAMVLVETQWIYTHNTGDDSNDAEIKSTYLINTETLFAKIPF